MKDMQNHHHFFIDPILNNIVFEKNTFHLFGKLIATPEFHRLNRIRQLGATDIAFPCATHTRLSHSLGTYEITRRFINHLGLFEKYPKRCIEILCAALLHDLGHGPNSHSFEKYTGINHEFYTGQIILDPTTSVNKILRANKLNPHNIVSILQNTNNEWSTSLIKSQIDADRMDYLLRDSWYTGAEYGQINPFYIISSSKIIGKKICFEKKAIHEIENLLIGRFHMYAKVYNHPFSLKHEFVVRNLLKISRSIYKSNKNDFFNLPNFSPLKPWFEDNHFEVNQFLLIDDYVFTNFIQQLKKINNPTIQKLLKAYNDHSKIWIYEYKNDLLNDIKKKYMVFDIVRTKKISIYNSMKSPINICDENSNKLIELSNVSNLLRKLKNFSEQKTYIIGLK